MPPCAVDAGRYLSFNPLTSFVVDGAALPALLNLCVLRMLPKAVVGAVLAECGGDLDVLDKAAADLRPVEVSQARGSAPR